jgi:hypothetical protein
MLTSSESSSFLDVPESDGHESPVLTDVQIAQKRNEWRYRQLLAHDFHPSRA